jgi:hypothetical protein
LRRPTLTPACCVFLLVVEAWKSVNTMLVDLKWTSYQSVKQPALFGSQLQTTCSTLDLEPSDDFDRPLSSISLCQASFVTKPRQAWQDDACLH